MSNPNSKLRSSTTTLVCYSCGEDKPVSEYRKSRPYSDGTIKYKSRCLVCERAQAREYRRRRGLKRIHSFEAPLSAAILLMRAKPEVLADIVRRYHNDYVLLLEKERKRMLHHYGQRCQAMVEVNERD